MTTEGERDPAAHGDQTRVLYVDDDPDLGRAVQRVLAAVGMPIDFAEDAERGLEMLARCEYAVVASDLRMPGMDGIAFLEQVRQLYPDTVCILVSGQADVNAVSQVIRRVGVFRFLVKPWDNEDLRSAVARACEQFELRRQNRWLVEALERNNAELSQVNRSLEAEVHRRTVDVLFGLLNALDLRDTETQGHSRRVALYARRLAGQLKLPPPEVLIVERGALLHDLGKIGVSDTILLKPGKLTEEEWVEMRRHTLYGHEILRSMDFLGDARLVVRSHHERFDGTGYPDGLKGAAIHIGARIFAVIDTYDAMTSDRPYRKALPNRVAREEIVKQRGRQFDPACADAFVAIADDELERIRALVAESPQAGLE
ncbi:MAG: HD domain-containing protein [Deltaproteobacteria bacterium]|nr:HD domain-containing protein [Deltaproteobacteria bacterium]